MSLFSPAGRWFAKVAVSYKLRSLLHLLGTVFVPVYRAQMLSAIKGLLLMASVSLVGCVHVPLTKPTHTTLKGVVYMSETLPRPAAVEVEILSAKAGQTISIATVRYEVSMLPITFDFRLASMKWEQGDLYVRTRLHFTDSVAIQASSRKKISSTFSSENLIIQLQPRSCYPDCQ